MKSLGIIYHLARADFLERVRRSSFLIMLGLTLFLAYQVATGNLGLSLDQYRGVFNSAWVGALMALIATMFVGWFGFYLVKGSVARDRETGVGQIMAATPLTRPVYMLGKWLSNFAVLTAMVTTLAVAGIALQLWKGESTQIDVAAYCAPFVFVVLPLLATVSGIAVLFEAVPLLQGGVGNVIYFVAFVLLIPLFQETGALKQYAALEPVGIALIQREMASAVSAAHPDYRGGFALGGSDVAQVGVFLWTGVSWTASLILGRLTLFAGALALPLLASTVFDRFDPSRTQFPHIKPQKPVPESDLVHQGPSKPAPVGHQLATPRLTPLGRMANRFNFFNVLVAECRLLVKGLRWWWFAAAAGLIVVSVANTSEPARQVILPITWIWPVLIWSTLGNRERRANAEQLTFSSAYPLLRQLPAHWLAGVLVALLISSGVVLRDGLDGNTAGVLASLSAAVFVPSLALAAGVWSGTSKLFEILYMGIWYLGPLNKLAQMDYIGVSSAGRPEFFIPLSIALVVFALWGRARQLRS